MHHDCKNCPASHRKLFAKSLRVIQLLALLLRTANAQNSDRITAILPTNFPCSGSVDITVVGPPKLERTHQGLPSSLTVFRCRVGLPACDPADQPICRVWKSPVAAENPRAGNCVRFHGMDVFLFGTLQDSNLRLSNELFGHRADDADQRSAHFLRLLLF